MIIASLILLKEVRFVVVFVELLFQLPEEFRAYGKSQALGYLQTSPGQGRIHSDGLRGLGGSLAEVNRFL